MEFEHMREVLATKAMGWRKMQLEIAPGVRAMYWVDANGKAIVLAKSWRPGESWPQAGLVIEAMREKGWTWFVRAYADGDTGVGLLRKDSKRGEVLAEEHLLEPHARMLAAARALEAANA